MTPYNVSITLLHYLIMKQQGVRTVLLRKVLADLKAAREQLSRMIIQTTMTDAVFQDSTTMTPPVMLDPVLAAMTRQAFMDRTVKGMASRQTVMYDGR